MSASVPATPGFGEADLSNCEREQIHLAASIQPCGALLVLREPTLDIVQASANAAEFLGLSADPLGLPVSILPGDLVHVVRRHAGRAGGDVPVRAAAEIGARGERFDVLLHHPPGAGLVVECERAGAGDAPAEHVGRLLQTIVGTSSLLALCDAGARAFREVAGHDRVMIYRFDQAGHGEVLAEEREPHLEAFLGNRYPASDIPQIARRLYERNRIRLLVDVAYTPVPLVPRLSPLTGADLDMSLCTLRSFSPIHLQYLTNMGVRATLVASLVVSGKLWGLVACHHYSPHYLPLETRMICDLLAEAIATRIAALESFAQAQAEISVRRLEQRMIEEVARKGDWRAALFDGAHPVTEPLRATGAALLFEDEVLTVGDVPSTARLRALAAWAEAQPRTGVRSTSSLGLDAPEFSDLTPFASGMVAAPISESGGEYLLWFRPELVRTITWGGDPRKPVLIGDNPLELSPRRSFAQWHQLVEGTSEPWSAADLASARLISESVADVVLQFRAVRTLIAQDQLNQVRRQVGASAQPVLITNEAGEVILANPAFLRLQGELMPPLERLEDLAARLLDPTPTRRQLRKLLHDRRSWRGEIRFRIPGRREGWPFMLRADPVLAGPRRVLGFVLLFTDLRERKAAEAARQRFQKEVVAVHHLRGERVDSEADLLFRNLLSPVAENAQLAALEITEAVELARMPGLLEGVQASFARSAELLGQLARGRISRLVQPRLRRASNQNEA
jgi:two-component system, chemotaxis family, sensor kinase Cph1